jgi:hypothetical protein
MEAAGRRRQWDALRWLLTPVAAVAGLLVAWAFLSGLSNGLEFAGASGRWRMEFVFSISAFLAGLLWVLFGAFVAPAWRARAAVLLFLGGAAASYALTAIPFRDVGVWLGYEWYPLLASLAGGGGALRVVAARAPDAGPLRLAWLAPLLPAFTAALFLVYSIPSGPFGGSPASVYLTDVSGEERRETMRFASAGYELGDDGYRWAGHEREETWWTWALRDAALLPELAAGATLAIDRGNSGVREPACAAAEDTDDARRYVEELLRRWHEQRWGTPPRKMGLPVPAPSLDGFVPVRVVFRACEANEPVSSNVAGPAHGSA